MYWKAPIAIEIRESYRLRNKRKSRTKQMVITALLIALTTMFQALSGIPGFGDFVRPLATMPIIIAMFLSIRHGLIAFVLTNVLLLMIQPPQIIFFSFFTGLIGVSIGLSIHVLKRRISLILFNAFALLISLISLLYLFQIPILGSSISSVFHFFTFGFVYFFAFVYTWICIDFSILLIKKLDAVLD